MSAAPPSVALPQPRYAGWPQGGPRPHHMPVTRPHSMRRTVAAVAPALALLTAGTLAAQAGAGAPALTPREAIVAAADAADSAAPAARVVRGTFELPVRATGRQDGRLYANSERDYRDQRNLTVAIEPAAEAGLRERLGADPAAALVGRRLRVTGAAQRVTIRFSCADGPSDKYYYQTHVRVFHADQVAIAPDPGGGAPGAR